MTVATSVLPASRPFFRKSRAAIAMISSPSTKFAVLVAEKHAIRVTVVSDSQYEHCDSLTALWISEG